MKKEKIDSSFGSIMIIVPHQDDEILLSAGVIYEAVKSGISIHVVMVTNGDYGCSDYSIGRARLKETLQGLRLLGVNEDKLMILGYADTGMSTEESFITYLYNETDEYKIYPSSCAEKTYGLQEKQEYHLEKHQLPATYCRASLKQDLKEIITEIKPQNIITTSAFDMHGDHAALYRFVVEILKELETESNYKPIVYAGIVHSIAGDQNWPKMETKKYDCPEGLEEQTDLVWDERICFDMPKCMRTEKGKKNLKYQALLKYDTALEPSAYDFLMSFIKDEEIFWKVKY